MAAAIFFFPFFLLLLVLNVLVSHWTTDETFDLQERLSLAHF